MAEDIGTDCRGCCRRRQEQVSAAPSSVCRTQHKHSREDTLSLRPDGKLSPRFCVRTTWTACVTVALLVLSQLSLGTCDRLAQSLVTPVFQPTDSLLRYSTDDSNSKQYYRCLQLHNNKLYVGAMNYVVQLDSSDITLNPIISLTLNSNSEKKTTCDNRSPSPQGEGYYCENHIRAIIPRSDDVLEVCGTAASSPLMFKLRADDITAPLMEEPRLESGKAICPPDPDDTNTVLSIMQHGQLVTYSGAVLDISKSDPVFYRPAIDGYSDLLLTQRHDSKTLNDPKFVASFDAGDFVYFFFRENAIEYMNCGKEVYSRIARVCKNDRGGNRQALQNRWTTYFKARLNCSIPGDYPFYFNELHDVYRIEGSVGMDTYYGLFTTNIDGLRRTAVCAFKDYDIQEVFNGSFKEQGDSNSNWQRVPDSRVPTPRPGLCAENSTVLPEGVLQFTMARPLMDQSVEQDTGYPMFYKDDAIFQKMVVATVTTDQEYKVFFLATEEGAIHKVVSWSTSASDERASKTVAVWQNFTRIHQSKKKKVPTATLR